MFRTIDAPVQHSGSAAINRSLHITKARRARWRWDVTSQDKVELSPSLQVLLASGEWAETIEGSPAARSAFALSQEESIWGRQRY
jgi:hypothetical protein